MWQSLFLLCGWLLTGLSSACNTVVMVHDRGEDSATGDAVGRLDTDSIGAEFCDSTHVEMLVCDDFEQGVPSQQTVLNGVVIASSVHPYGGELELHSTTWQEGGIGAARYPFLPVESGTVYFVAAVMIPADTITGTITLINLKGPTKDPAEESMGVDVNVDRDWAVQIYVHGNYTRYTSLPDQVPSDQWFCLRGSYSISQVAGEATIWIGDNLVVSTTAAKEVIITGGVSEFLVGVGWTENGQQHADVYMDNVAVATVPLNCF